MLDEVRRWCTSLVALQDLPGVAFNGYTRGTLLESDNCPGTGEAVDFLVKEVFKLFYKFYKAAGTEQESDRRM